jgi:hypothetical protein
VSTRFQRRFLTTPIRWSGVLLSLGPADSFDRSPTRPLARMKDFASQISAELGQIASRNSRT